MPLAPLCVMTYAVMASAVFPESYIGLLVFTQSVIANMSHVIGVSWLWSHAL
jgi:hypothetical protein